MRPDNAVIRIVLGGLLMGTLGGCVVEPPHSWEVTRADYPALKGSAKWPRLPASQYERVPDGANDAAVALLQEKPFVRLKSAQLGLFAPSLRLVSKQNLSPYLVRGVKLSAHPASTILRFDAPTGGLFIWQGSYNGEMLLPYARVAVPDALVVLLPREPDRIYPVAMMGGDGM